MNLMILSSSAIVIYISIIAYLGYSTSIEKSSEGFLIAGRNLKVFENVATIVASKIGAGVILTFVALYYLYGLSGTFLLRRLQSGQ